MRNEAFMTERFRSNTIAKASRRSFMLLSATAAVGAALRLQHNFGALGNEVAGKG
jgi:hypothetical protein